MKRLVCVLGSPKAKGNSASIAARLCAAAAAKGYETRTFALNDLDYRGCQACLACKGLSEICVIADDLGEVLYAAGEADVLVLASPVYYGDVSSQLKGFIDRTYSYLVPDWYGKKNPSRLRPGRKAVWVLTQGFRGEKSFADIYPKYRRFFKSYGFDESHLIRQCGADAEGSTEFRDAAFRKADALAAVLFKGIDIIAA
ncbi:MAG: NAD(P)H-dependent oxidoreductase [Elusimicrobia bacterium]|nr:NAD(P)H-dependent oxidoreductase [Elusimicrobiota bacterium]